MSTSLLASVQPRTGVPSQTPPPARFADPGLGHRHPLPLPTLRGEHGVGDDRAQHRRRLDDHDIDVGQVLPAPAGPARAGVGLDVAVPVEDLATVRHPSSGERWWVVSPPMNLYTQADFRTANVALSFHIGLIARVMSHHEVPIAPEPAKLGSSSERLRSYLKKMADETWAYVNWLTHAGNASSIDAEIGASAVSHFLATFTAARMRCEGLSRRRRCAQCDSYAMSGDTCSRCGWVDETYEPEALPAVSDDDRAAALDTPCEPSSNISTFVTPDDYR